LIHDGRQVHERRDQYKHHAGDHQHQPLRP
jgi:hypothetical protein